VRRISALMPGSIPAWRLVGKAWRNNLRFARDSAITYKLWQAPITNRLVSGSLSTLLSNLIEIPREIFQSAVHRDRGDNLPRPDFARELQGRNNVQSGGCPGENAFLPG
jgi:hypothetical protein